MKRINLVIVFCMVLLVIPMTSAFNFDNVKSYDAKTKTATIENWFGFGSELATIKLISNTDQCLINCEAEMQVSLNTDTIGSAFIERIRFYDRGNRKKNIDKYEIWVTETYEKITWNGEYGEVCDGDTCWEEIVKYTQGKKMVTEWRLFDPDKVYTGTFQVKIIGQKKLTEDVEWIPNYLGTDIDEWAWWSSSWEKRQEINITFANTVTNFPRFLNITKDSEMKQNYSDIRFVEGACSGVQNTEITYEYQSNNSNSAMFWLGFDSASAGLNQICMYYNNTAAASASDPVTLWDDAGAYAVYHFETGAGDWANSSTGILNGSHVTDLGFLSWEDGTILDGGLDFGSGGGGRMKSNDTGLERINTTSGYAIFWYGELDTLGEGEKFWALEDGGQQFQIVGNKLDMNFPNEHACANCPDIPTSGLFTAGVTMNKSGPCFAHNGTVNPSQCVPIVAQRDDTNKNYSIGNAFAGAGNTIDGRMYEFQFYKTPKPLEFMAELHQNINFSNVLFGDEKDLSTGEQSQIAIVLTLPEDDIDIASTIQQFNATFSVTEGNQTNATLFVWLSNSSIISKQNASVFGIVNATNFSVSGLLFKDDYEWNILGCMINGSLGHSCSFADANFTFDIAGFEEEANTFNIGIHETEWQSYELNISTESGVISVTAELIYNGTNYPATTLDVGGGKYNFQRNIDVPETYGVIDESNHTFWWQLTLGRASGTNFTNSSVQTQYVNNTWFGLCNATLTNNAVNFTIYNFTNPQPIANASFMITTQHWLGTGRQRSNYSFENVSETVQEYEFCLDPETTVNIDADIQIDADGFAPNTHFFRNKRISNANQTEQFLFLLADPLATVTIFKVVDDLQRGLANRIINVQFYDVGTGEVETVAMMSTNYLGEDLAYLNWFDTFYKVIIINNGTIERIVEPYKISATPQTIRISDVDEFPQDKFEDVSWSLDFNNVTKNFVLIFNDPNNKINGGCMRIVNATRPDKYEALYDNCVNGTSGTLTYNIGTATGTYFATFYAKGSFHVFQTIIKFIKEVSESIFEAIGILDATVLSLIIVGTVAFVGLFSPAGAVIMVIVGFVAAMGMGYYDTTNIVGFLVMVCFGGFLAWLLRN